MRPLKGVRIVDLTRHLPGPFAASLLAQLGADVVKVELPQMPDPARLHPPEGALFRFLNQGKQLKSMDFSRPKGRAALLKLLKGSRVLIEGFRPGLMKRLKLDYSRLKRQFPKLIYCSLSGYGQEGPYSRQAGHDLDYLAMSGALSQSDGLAPAPLADLSGAFYAALSIAAALRQPKGVYLDVSMTAAARSALHLPVSEAERTGKAPKRGERWWNGGDPFYSIYETKDGGRIAVAALEPAFASRLLELLDLKRLEALAGDRVGNGPLIREALAAAFKGRTRDEWTALLFEKEACVAPVLDVLEADDSPPVRWKQ